MIPSNEMLRILQVSKTSDDADSLPVPTAATIKLAAGVGFDTATTEWHFDTPHLPPIMNQINRRKYAYNFRHQGIPHTYGRWFPTIANITPHAYSSEMSIEWLRWDEPTDVERQLPEKIEQAIIRNAGFVTDPQINAVNKVFTVVGPDATLSYGPMASWNIALASMPPYDFRHDPYRPYTSPYPTFALPGRRRFAVVPYDQEFEAYLVEGRGLLNEILTDIFKNENQTIEDTLRELREYQLVPLFSKRDFNYREYERGSVYYTGSALDIDAAQFIIESLVPQPDASARVLNPRFIADAITYVRPLDNKATQPISCLYHPLTDWTESDLEPASGIFEYVDSIDPNRTPLRVKHPQKAREKAVLECHLQRYKWLEKYYRISFSMPMTDDTIQWCPLDTIEIPSRMHPDQHRTLGTVLEVEHSYPNSGPYMTNIKAKLYPEEFYNPEPNTSTGGTP